MAEYENTKEFVDRFINEPDRAAALHVTNILEQCIGDLIKSFCIKDDIVDDLLEVNGPFGPLSYRINVAYALGWITKDIYDDLHAIRNIRNYFAGHSSKAAFEDKEIQESLEKLSQKDCMHMPDESMQKKADFILTASYVISHLKDVMDNCKNEN
jgi:DNA-binding MltR family transcriptional regulator